MCKLPTTSDRVRLTSRSLPPIHKDLESAESVLTLTTIGPEILQIHSNFGAGYPSNASKKSAKDGDFTVIERDLIW